MARGVNRKALTLIFVSMLIMAFTAGLKGVLIPVWKNVFGINNQLISIIITLESFSYLVAIYFGGRLLSRVGASKVLSGSLAFLSLCLLGVFLSKSYFMLSFAMLAQGVAMGLITVAVNTTVPNFEVARKAVLINVVHFSFGLGLASSQRISGFLLHQNISWRMFFPVLAVVSFMASLLVYRTKMPQPSEESHKGMNKISKNNLIIAVGLIVVLGFYLIGEIGTSNWLVSYAVEGRGLDVNNSSYYLSLFFMLYTIGRLFGGFIVEKMSYMRAIILTTVISASLYGIGIMRGESGMMLISIAGLFQAIIYPTLMLVIAENFKSSQAKATANITSIAHLLYIVGNNFIGIMNDNMGVIRTFYVMPISLFISALVAVFVAILINKSKTEKVLG